MSTRSKNNLKAAIKSVSSDLLKSDITTDSTVLNTESFINKIVDAVSEQIQLVICEQLSKLSSEVNSLQQLLLAKDNKIDELAAEVDRLEQYSRRNCLRVFGVVEDARESTDTTALQLFEEKLGITLDQSAIDRSHRLGKQLKDKCRPIIVKFSRYNDRASVFANKSKLKSTGIVIREDLTKKRFDILNAAKKKFGLKNTWSRDGVIYIKTRSGLSSVNTMKEFNELVV